jgi:hypothetical protein
MRADISPSLSACPTTTRISPTPRRRTVACKYSSCMYSIVWCRLPSSIVFLLRNRPEFCARVRLNNKSQYRVPLSYNMRYGGVPTKSWDTTEKGLIMLHSKFKAHTEQILADLTLCTCIRTELSSNLGENNGWTELFYFFIQDLKALDGSVPRLGRASFLPNSFKSCHTMV